MPKSKLYWSLMPFFNANHLSYSRSRMSAYGLDQSEEPGTNGGSRRKAGVSLVEPASLSISMTVEPGSVGSPTAGEAAAPAGPAAPVWLSTDWACTGLNATSSQAQSAPTARVAMRMQCRTFTYPPSSCNAADPLRIEACRLSFE